MKEYSFDAIIKAHPSVDGAYIEFPYDVETEFGKKGQIKVVATFDGYAYRGSLIRMGYPCHIIGITQKIRKEIGKQPGDTVHVNIKQDTEERTVSVPGDLSILLAGSPAAAEVFSKLSYTHRKEYVNWINEAKREETRNKRLLKTIEMLSRSIKHP
jgi:hypothetical protein